MTSSNLITDAYRLQQAALHATGAYGVTGRRHGPVVAHLLDRLGARSLLDYGCGSRRSLLKGLQLPADVVYEGYDPCVPEYSHDPVPADLVVCIDVLEHIEPNLLDNVLDHLHSLCDPYGYFTVHTGPAEKMLPDGRNAHLIQKDAAWWIERMAGRFAVIEVGPNVGGFSVLVRSTGASAA